MIADAVKFAVVEEVDGDDRDGNGLPDAWERWHFLQDGGTDPLADPDGDGFTNRDEWLSNTDPLDPCSPLLISDFRKSPVEMTISWRAQAGHIYRVYMSETLDIESFRPFGDVLNGIDGEMTVSLPVGASPSAFYRVRDETP